MSTMKRSLVCPACDNDEIVYVPVVRDSGWNRLLVDHYIGFVAEEEYGEFEAYFCRACGFAELYVKGPRTIRLDRVLGAKVLRPKKSHPYR